MGWHGAGGEAHGAVVFRSARSPAPQQRPALPSRPLAASRRPPAPPSPRPPSGGSRPAAAPRSSVAAVGAPSAGGAPPLPAPRRSCTGGRPGARRPQPASPPPGPGGSPLAAADVERDRGERAAGGGERGGGTAAARRGSRDGELQRRRWEKKTGGERGGGGGRKPEPSPHGQPRLHPARRRRPPCAGSPAAAAPSGASSPALRDRPGAAGPALSPRRTNRVPRGDRSRPRNRCPHSSGGGGGGRANSRSPWPAAAPWLLPERAVIGRRPPRMQSSRGDDIPPHSARRSRRAAGRLHSSRRRRAPSGEPNGALRGPAWRAAGGRAGRKAVLPRRPEGCAPWKRALLRAAVRAGGCERRARLGTLRLVVPAFRCLRGVPPPSPSSPRQPFGGRETRGDSTRGCWKRG